MQVKNKAKRGRPATGRKATHAVTVRLTPSVSAALRKYRESFRHIPTTSTVLVDALQKFLREGGYEC